MSSLFAQGVIQLGAEGVHGNTTLLTQFADIMGWERIDNFVTSQAGRSENASPARTSHGALRLLCVMPPVS